MTEVLAMLSWYLVGSLTVAVATFALAGAQAPESTARPRRLARGALSIMAGALWPLLLLGALEVVSIRVVAWWLGAHHHGVGAEETAPRGMPLPV